MLRVSCLNSGQFVSSFMMQILQLLTCCCYVSDPTAFPPFPVSGLVAIYKKNTICRIQSLTVLDNFCYFNNGSGHKFLAYKREVCLIISSFYSISLIIFIFIFERDSNRPPQFLPTHIHTWNIFSAFHHVCITPLLVTHQKCQFSTF